MKLKIMDVTKLKPLLLKCYKLRDNKADNLRYIISGFIGRRMITKHQKLMVIEEIN